MPKTPEATPAAEKLAEESAVDLASVEGSGTDGRVTKSNPPAAVGAVVATYLGGGYIAGVPARDLDQADVDGLADEACSELQANMASAGPPDGPLPVYQGVN